MGHDPENGATVEHLGKMHSNIGQWAYHHIRHDDQKFAEHTDTKEKEN